MNAISNIFTKGSIVEGKVKKVNEKGVEIALPSGVHGWMPKHLISWDNTVNPLEKIILGQVIFGKVVHIYQKVVTLSAKNMQKMPFDVAIKEFPVGFRVQVKVARKTNVNLICTFKYGIKGIISMFSLDRDISKSVELFNQAKIGDFIDVTVAGHTNKHFLLSVPFLRDHEPLLAGTNLKGKVIAVYQDKICVQLENSNLTGVLITTRDITSYLKIALGKKHFKDIQIGDELDVVVLKSGWLDSCLVALAEPVKNPLEKYEKGQLIKVEVVDNKGGKLTVKMDIGFEVEILRILDKHLKIHTIDFSVNYPIGSFVEVKILDIKPEKCKVILSVNHANYDKEQAALLKYTPQGKQTLSLAIENIITNKKN